MTTLSPARPIPGALTPAGAQLKTAGEAAAALPAGPARAEAFRRRVVPLLLADLSALLQVNAEALEPVALRVARASGEEHPKRGLDPGGGRPNEEFPCRVSRAVWPEFAAAVGVAPGDAVEVLMLNARFGACPKPEDRYAPAPSTLAPELQQLARRVCLSLLGRDVQPPLLPLERAFQASLALNNLTWHATNWQRAAEEPERVDPQARNGVFNTYSDNLRQAYKRAGLEAVIDMAIADAFHAGQPLDDEG